MKLTGTAPSPARPGRPQPSVLQEAAPADDPLAAHSHLDDVRFDRHGSPLNAWR